MTPVARTTADRDVFRAIASPARRVLVDELAAGPRRFAELDAALPMTKGAVSQHLAVLASVGLVAVEEIDGERRYRLTPEPLAEADAWLAPYRRFWDERLDALDDAVRRRRP